MIKTKLATVKLSSHQHVRLRKQANLAFGPFHCVSLNQGTLVGYLWNGLIARPPGHVPVQCHIDIITRLLEGLPRLLVGSIGKSLAGIKRTVCESQASCCVRWLFFYPDHLMN